MMLAKQTEPLHSTSLKPSGVNLGARISEGVFVHFYECAFVDAHGAATSAPDLTVALFLAPDFVDPVAVATQQLALAQFPIAPQLLSAGCAFDDQHNRQLSIIRFFFNPGRTATKHGRAIFHRAGPGSKGVIVLRCPPQRHNSRLKQTPPNTILTPTAANFRLVAGQFAFPEFYP
nr:hypothetical protein [Desulfurivibrio alkaliphilus]